MLNYEYLSKFNKSKYKVFKITYEKDWKDKKFFSWYRKQERKMLKLTKENNIDDLKSINKEIRNNLIEMGYIKGDK